MKVPQTYTDTGCQIDWKPAEGFTHTVRLGAPTDPELDTREAYPDADLTNALVRYGGYEALLLKLSLATGFR